MKETRLLIIDTDTTSTNALCEHLSKRAEFKIVGTASDGAQAQALLESTRPDMVLMDLLLPELDGLCLLKQMQGMKRPPVAICQSEFYSSASIEAARRNGASYYVIKPLALNSIVSILLEYAAQLQDALQMRQTQKAIRDNDERMLRIHRILHSLGFSSKYSGSAYLAESILLTQESPMVLHNMSSGLYQELSTRLHVSPGSIERCIRTAIAAADADSHLSRQIGGAPTNKACIQYVLRMLESQQ